MAQERRGCGAFLGRMLALVLLLGGLYGIWSVLHRASARGPGAPGLWDTLRGRQGPRVGIVAGHWGSDSGAICDDGLQEVEVNLRIARAVQERLEQAGYQVDLLQEFDPRLEGYRASAFVSIHTDSCVALSGFKVARLPESDVPADADRLVQCLQREYALATGLPHHHNTITYDMTDYHAFREIHPLTPGAIIEVGFLGGDRALLTRSPSRVAEGIAEGVLCYMVSRYPTPTPSP
ncbi:MAG: N-acetylmuramoyl-L-alanine amidase [Anaerolineae bacterium]|nr:N-acetylmuramoyl-L-alanine amidase [Anaerolineae bacterium]